MGSESPCFKKKCGVEAACFVTKNGAAVCVCPHDHSLPEPDGTCPRRVVVANFGRDVSKIDHKRFKPIIVPLKKSAHEEGKANHVDVVQSSQEKADDQEILNVDLQPSVAFLGFLALFLVLLIIMFASGGIWLKRRARKKRRRPDSTLEVAPTIVATQNTLIPLERFHSNPSYGLTSVVGQHTEEEVFTMNMVPSDRLFLIGELGEGCFGKVFKGQMLDSDGSRRIVAVKISKDKYADSSTVESIVKEAQIMSTFSHENILNLVGVVDKGQSLPPWMVFEYMAHGDLTKMLRGETKKLTSALRLAQAELYKIAEQIASGMNYLTSRRFVHRDLACRNCLVGENLSVKIADFGMSRDIYACDYYKVGGSRLLPVRWMSPEAIVYGRFTLESDVWSYGVVLWEIYSYGKQPFYGNTNEEAVKTILQGIHLIPPPDCPLFITDIMEGCWRRDVDKRLNFEQILEQLETGYSSHQHEFKGMFSVDKDNYLISKREESGYFEPLDDDGPIMTDFYAVFDDLQKTIEADH